MQLMLQTTICDCLAFDLFAFEQDAVFERLIPALDFDLGLRMEKRSADMLDVLLVQPIGKIACDV
jgi:hypothetical protein